MSSERFKTVLQYLSNSLCSSQRTRESHIPGTFPLSLKQKYLKIHLLVCSYMLLRLERKNKIYKKKLESQEEIKRIFRKVSGQGTWKDVTRI